MEQEGADITAAHMVVNEGPSPIKDFYEGATVLITGGLGFLGRLTVEKILRSCPEVSRVYLIARPKKGKSAEERLEAIFNDALFERLLMQDPKFYTKVTLVNGDLEQENLGLTEEDQKMLINQVNIVLHMAATVRFDEKLRRAAYINIRAVKDLLMMAKKMQNLKSFTHVSTAYSHCTKKEVDEVFYETPITGDKLIDLVDLMDDEYLNAFTPSLLGKWPNTYTFTKAISELIIRQYGKGLPISIVRPSIVVSTLREPLAGWANTYYGLLGVTYGVGVGVIRSLYCDPAKTGDIVPADYTVNAIIAASWAIGQSNFDSNKEVLNNLAFDELNVEYNIPIFNYVCTPEKPIKWGEYMEGVSSEGLKTPSMNCVWYYVLFMNKYLFVHKLCCFFLHWIPAYIIDGVRYVIGKKPMLVAGYKKLDYVFDCLTYFIIGEWSFKNNNVQALWKKLSKSDQGVFEFSMSNVEWLSMFPTFVKGSRVYLFKDPLDTIPEAKKYYFKLKVAHYTLVYLLYGGLAYISWKILAPWIF